jgi:glucose-1-phosphate adenylyltransferase
MLPPAKVTRSTIERTIIGEGSIIVDSEITDSVIGVRSFIDSGTRITRSVLLGSDYYAWQGDPEARSPVQGPIRPGVGAGTTIEGAIIDRNAFIGQNCVIVNQEGVQEGQGPGFYIRDGIIVITKYAELPDGTVI